MPATPIDPQTGVTPADVVADAVHAMLVERFGDSAPWVAVRSPRKVRIGPVPGEIWAAWFRGRGVDADIVAQCLPVDERDGARIIPAADGGALLAW